MKVPRMSRDAKTIALVVTGAVAALGLAMIVGGWLMVGHAGHLMPYAEALGPGRPDPTIFPTVVGKGKPGVDLAEMLTTTPQMVAAGKKIYGTYCAACHGAAGKGDGPAAPVLKPPPRDFTSPRGWTRGYTLAAIYITLSDGVSGTGMGAFGMLSPQDRFAIAQYVESLGGFDHHDQQASEIAALDARYHLSTGTAAPNKVAVPTVMRHLAAEYQAPPSIEIPPASRTGRGAALCRRLVADPARAALVLSQVPDWRTNLEDFARAAMADTPRNGFRSAVATLDRTDWQAFHDALVRWTPAPGLPGAAPGRSGGLVRAAARGGERPAAGP